MKCDWGKFINGQIFIEEPIILDNEKLILMDELEKKKILILNKLGMRNFQE